MQAGGVTKRRKLQQAAKIVRAARATVRASRALSYGHPPRIGRYTSRGPELKTIDSGANAITAVGAGAGGSVVLLSGVAAGTDYTDRIGRKVCMTKLLMRYSIFPVATTTAPTGDVIRLMLIYDSQPNGALPTIATVLQTASYQAPINLNGRDRFQVISDQYLTLGANIYAAAALTVGSPEPKQLTVFRKGRWEAIFNSTTAAIADITSGTIILVALTQAGLTRLEYNCRIRFIDS